MKTLGAMMFVLFAATALGQNFVNPSKPTNEAKVEPRYVVVFRQWQSVNRQNGDAIYLAEEWVRHSEIFDSFDAMVDWLNSGPRYFSFRGSQEIRRTVRLSENELIGVYELSDLKKVKLNLKTEKQSRPYKVEIQKEEWEDVYWENP